MRRGLYVKSDRQINHIAGKEERMQETLIQEEDVVIELPEEILESVDACSCKCAGNAGAGSGTTTPR